MSEEGKNCLPIEKQSICLTGEIATDASKMKDMENYLETGEEIIKEVISSC